MPDWPELARILVERGGLAPQSDETAVASEYERMFGRVGLIEAVRNALHHDDAEPGQVHETFAALPFDTVYTTNFDLLLESAYGKIRRPYRSLVGELQLPFAGASPTVNIVKMHGDLRHEELIVLTREDYDAYLSKYPVVATHLAGLLITRTALFIGYSLRDPDFLNIRSAIQSRLGQFQRKPYAIGFNDSDHMQSIVAEDGTHVISLGAAKGKSETLAEFLSEIQKALDEEGTISLRSARPDAFEANTSPSPTSGRPNQRPGLASALAESSSSLAFVMMPFTPQLEPVYHEVIKPALLAHGLEPVRADELTALGQIVEQIRVAIQQSRVCVADLTHGNLNVMYEVGLAHSLSKPTILLTQDLEDVPFDLRSLRHIVYSMDEQGAARKQLSEFLNALLGGDQLVRAEKLLEQGETRGAVAALSVLMEQHLRRLARKAVSKPEDEVRSARLGISRLSKLLMEAGVLSELESATLKDLGSLRARAIHDSGEPTEEEVFEILEFVKAFVRAHPV